MWNTYVFSGQDLKLWITSSTARAPSDEMTTDFRGQKQKR